MRRGSAHVRSHTLRAGWPAGPARPAGCQEGCWLTDGLVRATRLLLWPYLTTLAKCGKSTAGRNQYAHTHTHTQMLFARCLRRAPLPFLRGLSGTSAFALDEALALEELDRDLYLQRLDALWTPEGSRSVFGGQIVGCAMLAAERSRTAEFPLHSMHAFFLRPGMSTGASAKPILYQVTRLRDGTSFETRAVTARQNGEAIFSAQLSFHKKELDRSGGAVGHAILPPDVPPPEECTPLRAGASKFPIEVRTCAPLSGEPSWPVRRAAWFKCPPLPPPTPSTAHLHRAALAFASDWGLGVACLAPYGIRWGDPRLTMAASLDHSLYFHDSFDGEVAESSPAAPARAANSAERPLLPILRHPDTPRVPASSVRADDWLLVQFESPFARFNRGLNISRTWTRGGTLVMTAVQECLVRVSGMPAGV